MGKTVNELESLIKKNKDLYYKGVPEISDLEYDQLEEELKKADPDNRVLKLVGTETRGNNKIEHEKPMLSLNKTYQVEELKKWIADKDVVSMNKVDGISCSLVYDKGKLVLGKTRGDGALGEDITKKILWMRSVPSQINTKLEKVEIRGELCCFQNSFIKLSNEMIGRGLDQPTSQRNIVAGIISRKDHLSLSKYINFLAFELISERSNFKTEVEKFDLLKSFKFETVQVFKHEAFVTVGTEIEKAKRFMAEGEYQIDGLVFSYNQINLHKEHGYTAHHPRYKMAFKFRGESKVSVIKKINWQVSRNGILTPIGEIVPVVLSGAKISKVTLHNYGLVKQYNLKQGDKIEIIRSGEVIPKFLSVIESCNAKFEIPENCPSCNQKVIKREIRLVCTNPLCTDKIKEQILNFIQKIGIEDLSSKRLDDLIKKGLIGSIDDLYRLKKEDLLKLDNYKEKLASKIIKSIEQSKNVDLSTFLTSLGLTGGAYNKSEKIIQSGIDSLEKIKKLTVQELSTIDSFAKKSSQEYLKSFKEKIPLINKLQKSGLKIQETVVEKKETVFFLKKICITGQLSRKRSLIEQEIRNAGGIVVTSVTAKTDYLLTNEQDSSSAKFKKAQTLKTLLITEDEFFESLKKSIA